MMLVKIVLITIEPCDTNHCVHGTCIVTGDLTYRCQCDPGFFGRKCESSKYSINHGTFGDW